MGTWAETDFTPDGADIGQATTIGTDLAFEDTLADNAFQGFIESFDHVGNEGFILCGQLGDDFLL